MEVFSLRLPELPIPTMKAELSFGPYLRYIEEQISTTQSEIYKTYLKSIAQLLRSNPELLEPIKDWQILEKHKELTELLNITHLSQVEGDNKLHAFGLPSSDSMTMNYFSWSDEFKDFVANNVKGIRLHGHATDDLYRDLYKEILSVCYSSYDEERSPEIALQIEEYKGKIKKYYRVIRRNSFADIIPTNDLPALREEWVEYAKGVISYDELEEKLPFNEFTVRGFLQFRIEEDTEEVALQELSKTVAQMHTYDHMEAHLLMKESSMSLIGNENIELGVVPFLQVNDDFVYHDVFADMSIILEKLKKYIPKSELEEVFRVITDISVNQKDTFTSLNNDICSDSKKDSKEQKIKDLLAKEGLNSLTLVPVENQGNVLGVIEIGSGFKDQVDNAVLQKIKLAVPFYREYMVYGRQQFEDVLKSFIMQRYTSIQPSVFWKFNEEVWNVFSDFTDESETVSAPTPIVRFNDLFPFYGAVDYRNSSVKQLQAIHSDYLLQLDYLKTLLQEGAALQSEEIDSFIISIEKWEQRIDTHMEIDDEYELRQFLDVEAMNFLTHLLSDDSIDREIFEDYQKSASAKGGIFHLSHSDYEESLQSLNNVLKEEMNKAEASLQSMVPHYFEKFQTDGIEYSLYAGRSIMPKKDFPHNAIDIIADWQIDSMLSMAKAAKAHKNELSIPLETTQLILIHENKVDISYRVDEKHFDVEGSYSIRYEVVKKRIDKVKLHNSDERLTQPNTIAIVYAHIRSCKPYLNRIEQLIKKGELDEQIEYLDLEQLHGVGKLKAIRVHISKEHAQSLNTKTQELNV